MKGLNAPLQSRSSATYERILDATERLLEDHPWPEISVQQIVRASRSSVGSFYARFKDKGVLLSCLSARLGDHAEAAARQAPAADATSFEAFLQLTIEELVRFHRERRGIIRALTLVPRLSSSDRFRADGLRTADVFRSIVEHPQAPDRERLALVMFVVATAIREKIVFSEISDALIDCDDDTFAEELTRMALSALASP